MPVQVLGKASGLEMGRKAEEAGIWCQWPSLHSKKEGACIRRLEDNFLDVSLCQFSPPRFQGLSLGHQSGYWEAPLTAEPVRKPGPSPDIPAFPGDGLKLCTRSYLLGYGYFDKDHQ